MVVRADELRRERCTTAWYAFLVWGRPAHPRLRVCFAMLAGLAPLHRERLRRARRPGRLRRRRLPRRLLLRRATPSTRCVREIGVDQLVLGSDRPGRRAPRAVARRRGPRRDPRAQPAAAARAGRRRWRSRRERASTAPSCATWSPGSPPTPSPGAGWCATARRSATSSSCGATSHVDVWVITWTNGNDTGFHDHDVSRGAVAVVEGEIVEERLVRRRRRRAAPPPAPGRRSTSTPRTCTACTRTAAAPAVSIHAYSPPLWRMGALLGGAGRDAAPRVDLLRRGAAARARGPGVP